MAVAQTNINVNQSEQTGEKMNQSKHTEKHSTGNKLRVEPNHFLNHRKLQRCLHKHA